MSTLSHAVPQKQGTGWLIVMALIILFLTIAYGGLPMTKHAQQAHKEQVWNASTISAYYDAGFCTPRIYECPELDFDVHVCSINPDKSIGLVISRSAEIIITGFMGPKGYFENRCPAN